MTRAPKIDAADLPRALGSVIDEVVALLEQQSVRYALIGGLAVGVHTQARATKDVDIAVLADEAESQAIVQAMARLGFRATVHGQAGPGAVARFSRTDDLGIVRWVDFLFAGTAFEEAAIARATSLGVLGRSVRVVTVEDLLVYKLLAGRPQDVADAVELVRTHDGRLDRGSLDATCASWELGDELERIVLLARGAG